MNSAKFPLINKISTAVVSFVFLLAVTLPVRAQTPSGVIKTKKDGETDQAYNARMRKTYLQLNGQKITNTSLDEIFDYPALKSLVLKSTQVDANGIRTITRHPEISFLSVERSAVNDGSLAILSGMSSLSMLDVSYTGVSDAGLRQLNNKNITFLNLTGTRASANSIPVILKQFPNLRRLDLMSIPITDDGMAALTGRKDMKELVDDLKKISEKSENEFFSDPGEDVGLENRGLKYLIDLNLAGTQITDKGLAALTLQRDVKILDLSVTSITPEGMKLLKRMDKIEVLSLNGTAFGDSEVNILEDLSNIKVLSLENTGLSDRGMRKLANLSNLFSLYVDSTLVTQDGIDKFLKKKPNCILHHSKLNVSVKKEKSGTQVK